MKTLREKFQVYRIRRAELRLPAKSYRVWIALRANGLTDSQDN